MPIVESVCVSVSTQVRWPDHGEATKSNSYLGTCRLEGALEANVTPPGLGSESLWGRNRIYYPPLFPASCFSPELWIEA